MILTKEYQYIAASNQMYAQSGGYFYYTEAYAKAVPDENTGFYTVSLRLLLTCSIESQFYQYATQFNGSVDGVSAFSGTNKPWSAWTEKGAAGYPAALIGEGSVSVDCSDGKVKEIPITALWKMGAGSNEYTPAPNQEAVIQKTVGLAAIPRASRITALTSSNNCIDGKITYTLTPSSDRMKNLHIISYDSGELFSEELGSFASPTTISVDLSERLNSIYESIKDANKTTIFVKLETYKDDNKVGEDTADITLLFPENNTTRPIINSATLSPKYIEGVNFNGAFVKGKCEVVCSVDADTLHGASIANTTVTLDGIELNGILSQAGTFDVEIRAVDTRGIPSVPLITPLTIHDYAPPIIVPYSNNSEVLCYRCDEDGIQSDEGNNVYLSFERQYSTFEGNVCKVFYRIREEGKAWGDRYTELNQYNGITSNVFDNPTKAYHIQLKIIDSGNEFTTKTFPIAGSWTDYQYDGSTKSWSFGEARSKDRQGAFSLGLTAYFDKASKPIDLYNGGDRLEITADQLLVPIDTVKLFNLYIVGVSGGSSLGLRHEDSIIFIGRNGHIDIGNTLTSDYSISYIKGII